MSDKIVIARVGKTHGIKGELKIHLDTDFPEQFKKGNTFYVGDEQLEIERYDAKNGLIKLIGFDSKEEAQILTNREISTTIEETRKNCKLKKGEYFWFDIMGIAVYEGELLLGAVSDVERIGSVDYFVVDTDEALSHLPKSFMVPNIPQYIYEINIKEGKIVTQGGLSLLEAS